MSYNLRCDSKATKHRPSTSFYMSLFPVSQVYIMFRRSDKVRMSSLVETVPETDDKEESFVNHQGRDKTTRTLL